MAEQAKTAGMKGFAIKSHAFPTAARAFAVQQLYSQLDIVSGITLNREVGGINPYAVEAAAKMGAKLLWFPTMDAKAYRREKKDPNWAAGLSILDAYGQISKQTQSVLEIAQKYDMVTATGHLGKAEAPVLIRAGCELGLRRLVLTHVTLPVCQMGITELKQCVQWGAMLEYSYCHLLSGKCSIEYVIRQIRAVGAEHIIISTDLGQSDNPTPTEGLQQFCELLLQNGVSTEELDQMLKTNPQQLLYGSI